MKISIKMVLWNYCAKYFVFWVNLCPLRTYLMNDLHSKIATAILWQTLVFWSVQRRPGPTQTSKMERFVRIVTGFYALTIATKSFIWDIYSGTRYASAVIFEISDWPLEIHTQMQNLWGNGRISRPEVFCKNGAILEISQNSQENTCARASF